MTKFKASWAIFVRSIQVMREHRTLLLFPIVITFFTLILACCFIAPVILQPTGYRISQSEHWKAVTATVFTQESLERIADKQHPPRHGQLQYNNRIVGYLAFLYFVSMFFAAFFNVAFSSQILSALRGGNASIGAGFRFAVTRWRPILYWSLLTGLVGVIIQNLEQRLGFIGRWVIALIGVVWSVASVFAIPILVEEPAIRNPVDVVRRSASVIKKTWGEALIGYFGLQVGGVITLAVLLLCGAVAIASAVFIDNFVLPFAALGVWLVFSVVFSYLASIAAQIYRCALYVYASTGTVPRQFDRPMMDSAWKTK